MNTQYQEIGSNGDILMKSLGVMEMLYKGKDITDSSFLVNPNDIEIQKYNSNSSKKLENNNYKLVNINERKNQWFYPEKYNSIDLKDYFLSLTKTDVEKDRVITELNEYERKGFITFLRYCIYLSDTLKQNDMVTGVGRGSSCASYLLYLINLHYCNSIKYGLDITEFLK